jgi:D-amino-acid dehydrogenase
MNLPRPGGSGEAIVIGGGIVGTCCALYLQRDGWKVTLLEREEPGHGCSFGNAGIRPSDIVPAIASPGLLWRVPRYMFDPDGPLKIRWSYLPRLAPWLYRFVRASRPDRYEASTLALATLLARVRESYAPLLESADAEDLVHRTGTLQVFETHDAFRDGKQEATFRRRLGARIEVLAPDEIRQFAPALAPIFRGAIYRPNVDFVANPLRLTSKLLESFERRGGTVRSSCFDQAPVATTTQTCSKRTASSSPPAPGRSSCCARRRSGFLSTPSAAITRHCRSRESSCACR